MRSPITKIAAAAIVTLATVIGIKMLGDLAEEPSGQIIKQEAPSDTVEGQRVVETLHAKLNEVRQMAAVGDVKGLARMLSTGRFESKLVAANFLAKMGKMPSLGRMPALDTLSIHASGGLIVGVGFRRLRKLVPGGEVSVGSQMSPARSPRGRSRFVHVSSRDIVSSVGSFPTRPPAMNEI